MRAKKGLGGERGIRIRISTYIVMIEPLHSTAAPTPKKSNGAINKMKAKNTPLRAIR